MIFCIQPKAFCRACFLTKIVFRDELHGCHIHHGDFFLILDININFTSAIALRLLGRATKIDRANHRAFVWIDHRNVGRYMAEHINAFCERFEKNAVWSPLNSDVFDFLQGHRIEHPNLLPAAKPVV